MVCSKEAEHMFWEAAGRPVSPILTYTSDNLTNPSFPQMWCLANTSCRALSLQTGPLAPQLRPVGELSILRYFFQELFFDFPLLPYLAFDEGVVSTLAILEVATLIVIATG
ncbi:hypothetical protein VN97_g8434 [Penicillium thymicola]|uniref:Uncharacterized protein n=1 Tax=Penicillium thymicola TaxID=293382 RepID=A0AAI9TDR5_PENTH|nr:hypothetical protein VN97_g8434 [Penicillium thymicola]